MKVRIDKLLVDKGLAQSRERASALILAGRVLVNEQKVEKPGVSVDSEAVLRMLGEDLKYVSRGGLKLERALDYWEINLNGIKCLDVGASTGGFTDCMLQRGAASVLAVDTGYGQIAQSLRSDSRVTLMERTNARLLVCGQLPTDIGFFAMDVSFISVSLVVSPVILAMGNVDTTWTKDRLSWSGGGVILVKPQFEVGRAGVGKGGIVRESAGHEFAVKRVRAAVVETGGKVLDVIDSPIKGMEGNKEFLMRAVWE